MPQFQGTLRTCIDGTHPLEALANVGEEVVRVSGDTEKAVKEALEKAVADRVRAQSETTWTFEVP